MKSETKAILSILVKEINDILDENPPDEVVAKVRELLDTWVRANNLHPEKVQTLYYSTRTGGGGGEVVDPRGRTYTS